MTMLFNCRTGRADLFLSPFEVGVVIASCRNSAVALITVALLTIGGSSISWAGPPAYLLVRRPESPGQHYRPGVADASAHDVRASGYAYGWFGAAPRSHASRHFGYFRTYTQWSKW